MLDGLHGHNLPGFVHLDRDLHRQEALRLVNGRIRGGLGGLHGRFLDGLDRLGGLQRHLDAIGRGGLHERAVDGGARQRHAALDVNLRRRQIRSDQRGKRVARQDVGAQAGRLVVALGRDRADLAVGHFNIDGKLVKALDGIRIARHARGSLAAERSGSLLQRIVDGVARQRHTALHVDLRGSDVLTHQRVKDGGIGNQVSAEARRLAMLRHGHGDDLAVRIHSDCDLERHKARHVVDSRALGGAAGSSLLQRVVDGVARERHAAAHVDLRGGDVLAHQRVKDGGIGNQVSAEARRLAVLRHGDGNDLARVIDGHLDLERRESRHVVGRRRHNRLSRLFAVAAVGRSRRGENRFLIARVRLNAQRVAGVGQHIAHSADKRGRGNRRAADGINVIVQRIGIGCDTDELALELILADSAAQTGGLLQRADIGLRHIAVNAHAERNRDLSAIALRIGHQRIAGELARGFIGALEEASHLAALRKPLDALDLLVLASGENRFQGSHLRRHLLFGNRALGHLIGDAQQHSRRE